MDEYYLIVLVLGIAFLGAALLPPLLRRSVLSLPMVYCVAGAGIYLLWPQAVRVDPVGHGFITERFTELAVIISLMSAGLKLDRDLGWKSWGSTWRLLMITMPLCILGLAVGGVFLLGIPLAAAVLLGAVAAPTDPVLASSVQVGPPGEGNEDEVRFALTSEAGLNDGLAFPFVNLAVVLAASGLALGGLTQWFAVDVVWKILAGTVVGALIGRLVAKAVFGFCRMNAVTDGFVALALTLIAYGATEMIHGYGFIAVFVAALVFRRSEKDHEYHRSLHDFSEQVETLLMALLLMLLGAAVMDGLLNPIGWREILLAMFFLLVLRPVAGWLGLLGTTSEGGHRARIAFFGIRGIGSFYYLAHALNVGDFNEAVARQLWAFTGLLVLLSVLVHGVTAPRAMKDSRAREASAG